MISLLILWIIVMFVIQILIIRKYEVKEKALLKKRLIVLEISQKAMDVLKKMICERNVNEDANIYETEMVKYIRDDLLECLAFGEFPVHGLIRAHPYIILKYPEVFELVGRYADKNTSALWEVKKEQVEYAMKSENGGT